MDHSNTISNNNPIAVAVDIGTTKVCAVAGRLNIYGKLEILAVAKVESDGVLRGVVSNIEKTVNAIDRSIRIIEQRLGKTVKAIHVGIAGQHIKSVQHRGSRMREQADIEISRRDLQMLESDMFRLVLPAGEKIIHIIPQDYTIDNEQGIVDPVGMSGVKLEGNFHIITGQIMAANNIKRCVEKVKLQMKDLTLEPLASGDAVLSDEEKEAGIALVDIGGGTTDLAVYHDNIVRHTAVIPFGGNAITRDIKEGCNVMQNQAEKLKVKFGCALAEEVHDDKIITIPGLKGRENKEISQHNLALIIQARVEEILDYVMLEVKKSGYINRLIGGIVVTGGGSMLRNIEKLVSYHTGFSSRIGLPIEHLAHGYSENVSSPVFSTAIGLLYRATKTITESELENTAPRHQHQMPVEVEITNQYATAQTKSNTHRASIENTERNTVTEKSSASLQNESEDQTPKIPWSQRVFKKAKEYFEAADDADLK